MVAVYIAPDAKTAAILEVNSETDFVAKNPEFQQMAADAAKLIAEQNPADVAALEPETGLYPCGEGAGYAGGIMSAACDGLRVASALVESLRPE